MVVLNNRYLKRFAALPKAQQDIIMHKTLAFGGACMMFAGAGALLSSNISPDDARTYGEYLWSLKDHFNGISDLPTLKGAFSAAVQDAKAALPQATLKEVWGTITTGALNCARNLGQWRYMLKGGSQIDTSTFEGMQLRRLKQSRSRLLSGYTNIPQLIEGITLLDPARIAAAGSAVTAYFISALRYDKSVHIHGKGEVYYPSYFMEHFPGNLMIFRGLAQASVVSDLHPMFGLAASVPIALAGVSQTAGAVMLKVSDKKRMHNEEPQPTTG